MSRRESVTRCRSLVTTLIVKTSKTLKTKWRKPVPRSHYLATSLSRLTQRLRLWRRETLRHKEATRSNILEITTSRRLEREMFWSKASTSLMRTSSWTQRCSTRRRRTKRCKASATWSVMERRQTSALANARACLRGWKLKNDPLIKYFNRTIFLVKRVPLDQPAVPRKPRRSL